MNRIIIKTDSIWTAARLADYLRAIDRLVVTVGIADSVAATCEAYEHVYTHLKVYGLLTAEGYSKPSDPFEIEVRDEYVEFSKQMRRIGVETSISHEGIKSRFLAADLYEHIPSHLKCEVESIKMASPGEIKLLTTILNSKFANGILEKIFDSLFFNDSFKRKEEAALRELEAKASLMEAMADKHRAEAVKAMAEALEAQSLATIDYTVALDSLHATLANAGIPQDQISNVVTSKLESEIKELAVARSLGLIKGIEIEKVKDADI